MNNTENYDFDLKNYTPNVRYLNDMPEVIFDNDWLEEQKQKNNNPALYYMYRELKKDGDLRYDITVIPPLLMGKEYTKTLGHFHQKKSNEIYIILEGEGLFIFQKGKDEVEDFYAVRGKKGDCVLVPEDYAHVTINDSNETLKMANWVKDKSDFDYPTVKNKKGLCYYFTTDGWIKNTEYKNIPKVVFKEPLKSMPDNLDFLK